MCVPTSRQKHNTLLAAGKNPAANLAGVEQALQAERNTMQQYGRAVDERQARLSALTQQARLAQEEAKAHLAAREVEGRFLQALQQAAARKQELQAQVVNLRRQQHCLQGNCIGVDAPQFPPRRPMELVQVR